jgi:hypothetical protein
MHRVVPGTTEIFSVAVGHTERDLRTGSKNLQENERSDKLDYVMRLTSGETLAISCVSPAQEVTAQLRTIHAEGERERATDG